MSEIPNDLSGYDKPSIPPEPNAVNQLISFVRKFPYFSENEKTKFADTCRYATAEDLRKMAADYDTRAEEMVSDAEEHGIAAKPAPIMQELAAALKDAADSLERDGAEMDPREALERARELYQMVTEEAATHNYDNYVDDQMQSPLLSAHIGDPQKLAEYYINRCEKEGTKSGILVAFHQRHNQLSEAQQLASLARNCYNVYLINRRRARDSQMRMPQDENEKQYYEDSAKKDLEFADGYYREYRILAQAVKALESEAE